MNNTETSSKTTNTTLEQRLTRGEMEIIFRQTGLSISEFFKQAKELYSVHWYYRKLNRDVIPLALANFFQDYVAAHITAEGYENLLSEIRGEHQ